MSATGFLVGLLMASPAAAGHERARPWNGPTIHLEDVDRFFEIYDRAGGRPTADVLQRNYLDVGTPGLRTFAQLRQITGARIAEAIGRRPQAYVDAKACAMTLPRVKGRLEVSLRTLKTHYPRARFPPVTVAIGRGKPVGVGGPTTGVQIGLEALCAATYLNPNVEDRFVHVIAHEFVHVQQASALTEGEGLTVLQASMMEGAAELVAEVISGDVAYAHLRAIVVGRELEIEMAFVADQDKTDLSAWLFNGTAEQPGDLGYWVGYRIAKAYYRNAADQRQALRDIIDMTDAKAFLAASGWRPGIVFNDPPREPGR